MKNVIFGIFGGMISLYVSILALFLFQYYSRENDLSKCLAQTMERIVEEYYGTSSTKEEIKNSLTEQLSDRLTMKSELKINVLCCDMQKGILSVEVELGYPTITKQECKIIQKKTILVDKNQMEGRFEDVTKEWIEVSFKRDGVMYKNYRLRKGNYIIIPELEEAKYYGWKNLSDETIYESGESYMVTEQVEFISVKK